MVQLMEKAIDEIRKLSDQEQELFAAWILEELASESQWDHAFANSQDVLATLADDALNEHRSGKTIALDPDAL